METLVVPKNGSTPTAPVTQIVIERLERRMMRVPIVGVTGYIPNKWSEKALRLMRDKQSNPNQAKKARVAKVAEDDANASTYWLIENELPGAPAVAFKAAIIGAVRQFEGLTMTAAKTLFYVRGEGPDLLVPLHDAQWRIREDTPRNTTGVADLRYRHEIYPWRAMLEIEFPIQRISPSSIAALVDEAGRGGIGDWRPSAPKSMTGIFGQWALDETREVELL